MPWSLSILGSNSAKPIFGRYTTSQYLDIGAKAFLIDAGEAVQMQISKFALSPNRIEAIFISHNHGDHILGLPGLMSSFSLTGRTKTLDVYAPKGLKEWIEMFTSISKGYLTYPVNYHLLEGDEPVSIFEDREVKVTAFPVVHRIPTYGFRFDEVKAPNISKEAIATFALSIEEIKNVKKGKNIFRKGKEIISKELLLPSQASRSYAFCADSLYSLEYLDSIKKVDLLYHEATYLHELAEKAKERMHATALEAGRLANVAQVQKLIIGHYSSRYKNIEPLLKEAQTEFANTYLAIEGDIHNI